MTLDMDICPGAAQRTEAAQHLIARARDGELVDLAVVSALDLCVLGGAEPPLLDEAVARAWNRLGGRLRDKTADAVTETLLDRGLLTDEGLRTSAPAPQRPLRAQAGTRPDTGRAAPSLVRRPHRGRGPGPARPAAVRPRRPGRGGPRARGGGTSGAATGPGSRVPWR